MRNSEYDIVIIGSGLGGLICGAILSNAGMRVCILEKNRQLGGCLQTFARDKVVFDSGVHYIGGLEKGQNLYQVFKYLGLMDVLKLQRMDEGFDRIFFLEDGGEYALSQGYDNFIRTLSTAFPGEEENIRRYCDTIREVCAKFPLYNLCIGEGYAGKATVLELDTKTFISSITGNTRLQEVLAGNNILYAGVADKTPLYVHALVTNSYIESSWKCMDGGSQISRQLARKIRANGGVIRNRAAVVKIVEDEGNITHVELADGEKVYGKKFISNLHPQQTLEMTHSSMLRKMYRNRIASLENSISSFTVHAVLKPGSMPYYGHNYYLHEKNGVWDAVHGKEDIWPQTCGVFFGPSSRSDTYAESVCLLTYMRYDAVANWKETFNTEDQPSDRGNGYEAFKKEKAEQLIAFAEKKFPGLRDKIQAYYTSTPLSYRDYIGSSDGSMYGITKDYRDPASTFIASRTKIPNLYLTGQNLVLHGILGVTISALTTCGEFVDLSVLIEKIKHA